HILVLQVDIDLSGDRIVLRDAGLAVEAQDLRDGVRLDVDDTLGLGSFVGHVRLVKRRSVSDAIGFGFGRNSLDHGHASEIDHADLVFSPVRRVNLLALGNVCYAFDAGHSADALDHRVRPKIDYVQESGGEMSRQQVVVVFIDRQIIEALAGRPWELELRNLSQCWMSYRRLSPDVTVPGPHANRHRGNQRHDKGWP